MGVERARVVRAWAESSTLRGLALAGDGLAARYLAPGQYVEIAFGGARGHFALASRPGESPIELLYKPHGKVTEALAALAPGDDLAVSGPSGAGFALAEHEGRGLLCAPRGRIAPLRAVILEILPRRADFGEIVLYYSQRAPDELAYTRDYASWKAARIDVVPIVSGAAKAWDGLSGRVQDAVAAARIDPPETVAYLCGMRAMIGEVSRVLVDKGLERGQILLNY